MKAFDTTRRHDTVIVKTDCTRRIAREFLLLLFVIAIYLSIYLSISIIIKVYYFIYRDAPAVACEAPLLHAFRAGGAGCAQRYDKIHSPTAFLEPLQDWGDARDLPAIILVEILLPKTTRTLY